MFAGQPVPFDFYDLRASDVTQGHRVLGRSLLVDRASHYERHLHEQHVIADHDERRRLIVEGLDKAAAKLGGRWSDPAGVLEENIYLAEWPSVHAGAFDPGHLRLPREVLVTAMQAHQRYCPVEDASGRLLPAFLYVSNADPAAAALITHGNERVLEGRLDDAEFSYDRDLAEGLAAMAARLGEVVFHAKLGSLADKSARLVALTQRLAGWVGGPGDREAVAAAADLGLTAPVTGELPAAVIAARYAKADLVSQVVIEFPSLQGQVGGVYAATAGAAPAVARAITEHYQPLSAVAPIPGTLAGGLVAVAEKIDNIAGAWLAAEKPSGSRDPYGLRRAAMGIVRIALENDLHIVPRALAAAAIETYAEPADPAKAVPASSASGADPEGEIAAFIWERLEGLLLDEGLPFPLVEAALGAAAPSSAAAAPADLPRVAALARAFARLESEPFFNDVVVAYTRPAALAARAAAEPGGVPAQPDPARFSDEAEHALAAALAEVRGPHRHRPRRRRRRGGAARRRHAEGARRPLLRQRPRHGQRPGRAGGSTASPASPGNLLLGGLGDFARLPVQQG